MSDDLWWSLLSESVKGLEADLPSFAPSLQAAPESFEEELDEELEGLEPGSFDGDVQLPTSLDGPFPAYRQLTPSLGSQSESTYSTEFSDDPAISDYSSMTYSTSNYSSPFDIGLLDVDFGSEYNGVDVKHNSMFSEPSAFLDSFGSLEFSPTLFQQIYVVKDEFDDGPYRPSVGISPQILSTPFQSPPPAVPADPPVCAASTTQSRAGPIRTKYVCPHCGHPSARKHNLKTHMDTHNPNRNKPFVCPESDCGHPFTRKHDLKRHFDSMHGTK